MIHSFEKMKVACIGNTNNMMFTLCRYLRGRNIDAHLFLFNDEAAHFSPAADTYDDTYKSYTQVLPIGRENLHRIKENSRILKEKFSGFDFFIGTDLAPAVMAMVGKKLDVFVPHGTDIYHYPFITRPDEKVNRVYWSRSIYLAGIIQKIAVRQVPVILFPDEYDIHFPFKKKLACKGKFVNTSGPMVYAPQYHDPSVKILFEKLEHYPAFLQLRKKFQLILFSHSRQNGFDLTGNNQIHYKGNDRLIQGFAGFVKQYPQIEACLVMFEYGMNVQASKEMVEQCGIDNRVIWLPKMERKEIMACLTAADIGCGIFASSWLTCGVVNEVLSVGKPLLHYRDDSLYKQDYASLYSLLNARSSEEITNALSYYTEHTKEVIDESKKGTGWLEQFTVDQPLRIILQAMEAKKNHPDGSLPFAAMLHLRFSRMAVWCKTSWYKIMAKLGR